MNVFQLLQKAFSRKGDTFVPDSVRLGGGIGIGGIRYFNISDSDAINNTVVMAGIRWRLAACLEPDIQVFKHVDGEDVEVENHGASSVLSAPMAGVKPQVSSAGGRPIKPKASGRHLRQWIAFCTMMDGNAYLYKIRNAAGQVIGLDPLPYGSVSPVAFPGLFDLDYYQVASGLGKPDKVHPDDMVHIREGHPDPLNPLVWCSPLKSAMRHILTDNEIAVYTYAVLRNPAPGMVMGVNHQDFNAQKANELAAAISEKSSREKAGATIVLPGELSLTTVGYSPDQMALEKLPTLSEERICAVLGIPPVILSIGAGLDAATYSNYEQALKSAVLFNLIPHWTNLCDELTSQLLPDFEKGTGLRFGFDRSTVQALQEDENKRHERVRADFTANLIDRATALKLNRIDADPLRDEGVYSYMLRPAMGAVSPESMPQGVAAARAARLRAENG